MRSIETTFDARRNGLNLVRLLLASGVLLRHSFTMLGVPAWGPVDTLLLSAMVDGFFAISGFLIVRSWLRTPDWRRFLRARCLRILPAFWVCLLLTAAVVAPVHALLTGRPVTTGFVASAAGYVWHNAALWIFQPGIAGGPLGASAAESGTWNGSLWTLSFEFLCYLGVLALGLTGLLRRAWAVPVAFVGFYAVMVVTDVALPDAYLLHHVARFGTMFLAGALVYQFRGRIPVAGWLLALMAAVVLVSTPLPDYRIVAALPLAYVCIVAGSLITSPRLQLRNDISYGVYIYGFPVQQLLVGAGLGPGRLPVGAFFALSVLCVFPVAAASWFLVEKPAQRWRRPARPSADRAVDAPVGGAVGGAVGGPGGGAGVTGCPS